MNNTALIYDITFYQVDEEGNDLLDDKGNTVNLNGHNWSFSMIIDEIYQH